MDRWQKWRSRAVTGVALTMALYHLYTGAFGSPEALKHRSIHLAFTFILTFLLFPFSKRRPWRWAAPVNLLFLVLGLAAIAYLSWNYDSIMTRFPYVDPLSKGDLFFGIVTIALVLEASRRTLGPALPLTALSFLIYAWAGPYLPGPLKHRGFSVEVIVDQMYLVTEGIFGIPLGVSASYVILFILFGTFLEKSGAGQLFMDFASAVTGKARGGPGKISCVTSGLFGTISGSAVANVMVDGWFTIPLMKRTGFAPHFAAAVEATASTGGQLMPPIMGAAAFVMAEFLGIPYISVAKHALIPALLYYLALFMSIHFEAVRTGLQGLSREELPGLKRVLVARGHLFAPLIVVVYLMIRGYTPMYAALYAILATVLFSLLRRETRLGPREILKALEEGARNTVPIATACAAAGIVVGVVTLTGLGITFSSLVVGAAGQSLIPALLLTMAAGIVLGMGMPTTPAYIIQAALLVPALIRLGVHPVAAHLFVFYFAILSAITPPVALAVYAAAGISRADLWKTGVAAMKVGAAGFIVPYMFVYGPSLLFIGPFWQILLTLFTASGGVILLAAGLQGWLLEETRSFERLLLVSAAILLIKPGLVTDLLGIVLFFGAALSQRLRTRPERVGVEARAGEIER